MGAICVFLFLSDNHSLGEGLIGCGVLSLMLSIVILFVYKLVAIYLSTKKHQPSISKNKRTPGEIQASSKMTILSVVLMVSTCLHVLTALTLYNTNFEEIYHLFELLDVGCNFVCVMLCFRGYHKFYAGACACCISLCNGTCIKMTDAAADMVESQVRTENQERVESESPQKSVATADV